MENNISLLIADDHHLIINGIKEVLAKNNFVAKISTAKNGQEAYDFILKNTVDILIFDIEMPKMRGTELCQKVHENYPLIKMIAITRHDETYVYKSLIENGVNCIVDKDDEENAIYFALKNAIKGGSWYSKSISDILARCVDVTNSVITDQEIKILRLSADWMVAKDIAEKLHLSQRTVEKYKEILMQKFNASNTTNLIVKAKDMGLI